MLTGSFILVALGLAFLLVRLLPAGMRLGAWTVLIVLIVAPWASYVGHVHWDRVQWIPFRPPPDSTVRDAVANIALYVPFGLFGTDSLRRNRPGLILAFAGTLSFLTEFSQLYSHGRFPAATDLLTNLCGAVIGVGVAWRLAASGRGGGTGRRHTF